MDDLPISAQLTIAQDPDADALLSADPFALLMGMLLDQQFPMERAFAGPLKISQRFGTVDPGVVPLVVASGAGSASQHAIGTGVLGGMLSATTLSVFFVPLFYVVVRRLFKGSERQRKLHAHELDGAAAEGRS